MPRVSVRTATPADREAVLNVLDGAALRTDLATVEASIDRGETLVAVSDSIEAATGDAVVGALVLDGDEIFAVAVRRRRRGQGIGTALVEAAMERRDRLTAAFDADVCPFYGSLEFEIEPATEHDRFRGQWRASD